MGKKKTGAKTTDEAGAISQDESATPAGPEPTPDAKADKKARKAEKQARKQAGKGDAAAPADEEGAEAMTARRYAREMKKLHVELVKLQ